MELAQTMGTRTCICLASFAAWQLVALSQKHQSLASAEQVWSSCVGPGLCSSEPDDEESYMQISSMVDAKLQPAAKHGAPPSVAEQQRIRLQSIKPVWWLHVPKCGSSFANVLMMLPSMCLPNFPRERHDKMEMPYDTDENCPGSFVSEGRFFVGDHTAVGMDYENLVKGHGLVMLRQPEQRIISAYYNKFHSWPLWHFQRDPVDILEFAKVTTGCAVRMLTRDELGREAGHAEATACGSLQPATAAEVSLAKRRLREGFVFTGIQEEWDLSMCLFHVMFGGDCLESDFANTHLRFFGNTDQDPNASNATYQDTLYDVSMLNGYKDVPDGALYEEATSIFWENMQQYGVNQKTCQPCLQQAANASRLIKSGHT
jgi:hypothetical protein